MARGAVRTAAPGPAVLLFRGSVCDRNPRAAEGAARVAALLAARLGGKVVPVGKPATPRSFDWRDELEAARPALEDLARAAGKRLDTVADLATGAPLIVVAPHCAASIGLLPAVAARHPEVTVLWFDAHGDLNTPETSKTAYLGGMVLGAACGWFDSGVGGGLDPSRIVLAGARDLDPAEREATRAHWVAVVPPGPGFADRVAGAVGESGAGPVYVHVDTDVLDAGVVPNEYASPGGISALELREALAAVAASARIVGMGVAEVEASGDEAADAAAAALVVDALAPVLPVKN